MLSIGLLFVLSFSLFSLLAFIVSLEKRRDKRLLLVGFRHFLDNFIGRATIFLTAKFTYLGRHIIKLSWYYGIHKILRLVLTALVRAYDLLEAIFVRNRNRARNLKIEKWSMLQNQGHLGQVAEHKASTALTENQKKKLLQKKLERG